MARIIDVANSFIGKDASPNDVAPDELGCAETVSEILKAAGCGNPIFVSTTRLNEYLSSNPNWMKVLTPEAGDVIMSPTGMGGANGITHGHTGIVLKPTLIASNDSNTGMFVPNYTMEKWKLRWKDTGDYPIFFYRYKPEEIQKLTLKIRILQLKIQIMKLLGYA